MFSYVYERQHERAVQQSPPSPIRITKYFIRQFGQSSNAEYRSANAKRLTTRTVAEERTVNIAIGSSVLNRIDDSPGTRKQFPAHSTLRVCVHVVILCTFSE